MASFLHNTSLHVLLNSSRVHDLISTPMSAQAVTTRNSPAPSVSLTTESAPAWSSPTSTSAQAITFGIAACLLALVALYISYRQLRALRLHVDHPGSVHDLERRPQSWRDRAQTSGLGTVSNRLDGEACLLLSSESYTLHRVVTVSKPQDLPYFERLQSWAESK